MRQRAGQRFGCKLVREAGLIVRVKVRVAAPLVSRLPGATWIRLQRLIEQWPTALVLLGDAHLAHGPSGASVALRGEQALWSGAAGPGRLLRGLRVEARSGRQLARAARFDLPASYQKPRCIGCAG